VAFKPYVEATVSPDVTICALDTAMLHASGGLYYQWEPVGAGILSPQDSATKAIPLESTTYEVKVSDECYTDSAEVTVFVEALPEYSIAPDTSIYLGDMARLYVDPAPDVDSVHWYPARHLATGETPTSPRIMAQPDTASFVYVYVGNEAGCKVHDSVFVDILEGYVTIPNAFAPNGDGLNDLFFIITNGDVTVHTFRIYNRWGELVYEYGGDADATNGWDGTFRGKMQDPGTYTYVYDVTTDDHSKQHFKGTGSVTLIR
jgi:gliding motility-associated-like protein